MSSRRGLHLASRAQRQIGRLDLAVLSHQHRALDHVIQLADVALPGMLQHQLQGRAVEPADAFAIALRVRCQKMRAQQRNVFAPFPQRRQMDLDGVQAEQQVLPEAPGIALLRPDGRWWPRSRAHPRAWSSTIPRAPSRPLPERAASSPANSSGRWRSHPETACRRRPARSGPRDPSWRR